MILPKCELCKNEDTVICDLCNAYEGYKFEKDPGKQEIIKFPSKTNDLIYQFTTNIFGKPKVIYSRRQYKRLLKSNGLADSTPKECLTVKPDKGKEKQERRWLAKQIASKMYKDNVSHSLKSYLSDFYVRRNKK